MTRDERPGGGDSHHLPYSRRRGESRRPSQPSRRADRKHTPRAEQEHRHPGLSIVVKALFGIASVICVVLVAVGWTVTGKLSNDLFTDSSHADKQSTNGEQNILIMGLDSRLDVRGNPLPDDVYNALHAGDQADGGLNANVLMLVHIPAGNKKPIAISIPRDNYVPLHGCPDQVCWGKIKQAYGLAADEKRQALASSGKSPADIEKAARSAGRTAEMNTVSDFLGDFPVDHYVEVTLGAFYELAQAIQPIKLCVAEATQDDFSGANFQPGWQDMSAQQAVAYVRQRRDTTDASTDLTDMDRERRQQAFLAAVGKQLATSGTLTSPQKASKILNIVHNDVAVDDRFDINDLIAHSSGLLGQSATFYTLPIDHFDTTDEGEDVNIVNIPLVRKIAWGLVYPNAKIPESLLKAPTTGTTTTSAAPTGDVDSLGNPIDGSTTAPGSDTTDSSTPVVPSTVPAGQTPQPTDLSVLDGSSNVCVK